MIIRYLNGFFGVWSLEEILSYWFKNFIWGEYRVRILLFFFEIDVIMLKILMRLGFFCIMCLYYCYRFKG